MALGLTACGVQGIPCEIEWILETKCLRCHQEGNALDAPSGFDSMAALKEVNPAIEDDLPLYREIELAVESDYMPPLELETLPPVEPLTAEEKETLLRWVRAGAPPGSRALCAP